MSKPVRVDPEAEEEIAAAIDWTALGAKPLVELAIVASRNGHGSKRVSRPPPLR